MAAFDPTLFQRLADALHGTGGFAQGEYLVQYPRESDDKFARRKAIAWYANALRPACQRFAGYLSKRPPFREVTHPALRAFLDACNWQNDSLDVFWSGFMIEAKARGCLLLLVDMPAETMETERTWPALTLYPDLNGKVFVELMGQALAAADAAGYWEAGHGG